MTAILDNGLGIKKFRMSHNIKQGTLAKYLGISQSKLSRLEREKKSTGDVLTPHEREQLNKFYEVIKYGTTNS